jgi:hypothetical protein
MAGRQHSHDRFSGTGAHARAFPPAKQKEPAMSTLDKIDPPVVEPDRVQPQPPQGRGEHTVVTGDTARQGPGGSRVLMVMLFGTIGAFVLMAVVYAFFAAPLP